MEKVGQKFYWSTYSHSLLPFYLWSLTQRLKSLRSDVILARMLLDYAVTLFRALRKQLALSCTIGIFRIALIQPIGKVMETLLFNRLPKYVKNKKVFSDLQYEEINWALDYIMFEKKKTTTCLKSGPEYLFFFFG